MTGTVDRVSTEDIPAGIDSRPLLAVDDLAVEFRTRDGVIRAVDGVSYTLDPGETLAILGESGSGKSVSAQAVLGILDSPPAFVTRGTIRYHGRDLRKLPEQERRRVRGSGISMVFQDALTALNPVYPVGWQIAEMFRVHEGTPKTRAMDHAVELMERVHIPSAAQRVRDYPHQFSGGMRQRVMIAMALALSPDIIIADEPTTALDVTVQAQIMELLAELQKDTGMGLILITHDLGVVAQVADRVCVMYAGRVVETAGIHELYNRPAHPYTEGLIASIPRLENKGGELNPIGGSPPNLMRVPPGCSFHPRCPYARERCRVDEPPLYRVTHDRRSACHYYPEVYGE
jgi:oligopeptide transport system ATP-binding protein